MADKWDERFDRDLDRAYRHPIWTTIKWGVGLIFEIGVIGFVTGWIGTASKIASTPSRILNKTFDTNNVINNYEWFHDVNGRYMARVSQIREYKGFYSAAEAGDEKNRLRTEMAAMQQSCRDLVQQYNANSIKTNRDIFKGRDAPADLDPATCE